MSRAIEAMRLVETLVQAERYAVQYEDEEDQAERIGKDCDKARKALRKYLDAWEARKG